MRVAIVIWPAPAHLYPLTPITWALRSAGHEVVVVSHPVIGPAVIGQGLPFAPFCAADAVNPQGPAAPFPQERADVDRISAALGVPAEDLGIWNTVSQFFIPSMWDFTPY